MHRPKTLILDIDGCLVWHSGTLAGQILQDAVLLPGVLERFEEWHRAGYAIILLTGRRESMRRQTEECLARLGLAWDTLVCGAGGGVRVLVNDLKPGSDAPTAIGVNLVRNTGLAELEV